MTKKIGKETLEHITNSIHLANAFGIDGLIYDKHGIRGYNDDDGVMIAALKDFDFEFEKMALSRVATLKPKILLLNKLENVKVEYEEKFKGEETLVSKLIFKSNKLQFDFRCANPNTVRSVPTKLKKSPIFSFEMSKDDVNQLTHSYSAMRTKNMSITGNDEKIEFKLTDDAGDVLTYELESELECHTDENEVSFVLNLQKMLPIFRMAVDHEDLLTINILTNNTLLIDIKGLDFIVMPEV